jgi:arginine-tRNA-protein transferase
MNSYHPKSPLNELQYYITPPHDCSYLDHKSARMVFLDPAQRIDVVTLSELSRSGFRRSGDFVYRPECHLCRQCLSCRIPVNDFVMNSAQKRHGSTIKICTCALYVPKMQHPFITICTNATLTYATMMVTCFQRVLISSTNF